MAEPLRIGKFHPPPHVRHGADNLAVDEVADASHSQQDRGGHDKRVGQRQQRLPVAVRKRASPDYTAEEHPVGSHPAQPERGNQLQVLPVEGPLVERDLDGAAADENAGGHEQAQAPHLPGRQVQPPPGAACVKKCSSRNPSAKPSPYHQKMHAADIEQNRVDPVDVGSEHPSCVSRTVAAKPGALLPENVPCRGTDGA